METKGTTNLLLVGILVILAFSAFNIYGFIANKNKVIVTSLIKEGDTIKANSINITTIDNDKSHLVEKVCIDGYVYINIYQKKPVMTIQLGTQTALTRFPVLQSTTQSFISNELSISEPEKCKNSKVDIPESLATTSDRKNPISDKVIKLKGKKLYAKCAGCHGIYGRKSAMGKSAIIGGQSVADLERKITAYKAGTRDETGMGMLMKGQVSLFRKEDINALANYITSL